MRGFGFAVLNTGLSKQNKVLEFWADFRDDYYRELFSFIIYIYIYIYIGALIIRIRIWGPLYYTYTKEPPKYYWSLFRHLQ